MQVQNDKQIKQSVNSAAFQKTSNICHLCRTYLFEVVFHPQFVTEMKKNAETAGENALLQLPYELGDK